VSPWYCKLRPPATNGSCIWWLCKWVIYLPDWDKGFIVRPGGIRIMRGCLDRIDAGVSGLGCAEELLILEIMN